MPVLSEELSAAKDAEGAAPRLGLAYDAKSAPAKPAAPAEAPAIRRG